LLQLFANLIWDKGIASEDLRQEDSDERIVSEELKDGSLATQY
jgi:hypothetical protein